MSLSVPADDRFAILDLFARYSRALDTCDADGYAALFTPDATLGMGQRRFHGRDEIRDHVREITSAATWPGYQHLNTQILFEEGDGRRCSVSCYSAILHLEEGGPRVVLQGIYRSICEKQDGFWYFAERLWETWDPGKLAEYRPAPR